MAPASVTLAGPLLSASGGRLSALFSLLNVERSSFASSTPNPLIQLAGTSVNLGGPDPFNNNTQTIARLLSVVASATAGTVGPSASISLAGPLLSASESTLTMNRDVLGVFNGATFASTTTAPLVQLSGGSLTTRDFGFPGFVMNASATGGPSGGGFSSISLAGSLLDSTSTLDLAGGLANVAPGAQVTETGSSLPFVSITGGSHHIATADIVDPAMFRLFGRPNATAVDQESGLPLGTDRPIQGALLLDGTRPISTPLLETTGATITSQKVLHIDSGVLEATAPLLNLKANGATPSVLTATGNAIDLSFQARVSALGGSLIRVDRSTLNVNGGSLVNVNASKLSVGGDLVTLLNVATLAVSNGPLITVSANGFVTINGSLVNFGGTGNTLKITNSLCPCTSFGGVPVALQNGAQAANVFITNGINNAAGNQVTLSQNAAVAVVNGAGSKLTVGPR